jgi:hypothetical protein
MANDDLLPRQSRGRVAISQLRSPAQASPKVPELRKQFLVALSISVAAGGLAGLLLGEKTGVKPAIEAARTEDAKLARAASSALEPLAGGSSVASLIDELRSLRAQMEQMRHAAETQRAAERLKTVESAQSANGDALQGVENAIATLAARLGQMDDRLARLERFGSDATPVGAICQAEQPPPPEKKARKRTR